MSNVRVAAGHTLLAVAAGRTTLAAEIDRAREGMTDRRDRALLIELVAGTLRWKHELDAVIVAASRRRIEQIDPRALAVLEIGAYQARHLDRIPSHAIVNESVEAVRALGAPRAAGFVNAVLRAIVQREWTRVLPARPANAADEAAQIDYLSVTLSHPAWLVRRWLVRYGFEATERWCLFNNAAPELTIRSSGRLSTNDLRERLAAHGANAAEAPFARGALRLPPGTLSRIPEELAREFVVQDEGSQLVARAAGARPGERVLDVCASPGGKTLVLAEDMRLGPGTDDGSLLVAGDNRPARVALLARTIGTAGLAIPVLSLDAQAPLPFAATFDRVLLDVPCSGLGTLRRDPDLKWTRGEADLPRLAANARRMLDHAAAVVRPGGRLVYATCSSEPEENDEVVDRFLADRSDFQPAAAATADIAPALLNASGRLVTKPFRHGLDAFFAAVLVRRTSA